VLSRWDDAVSATDLGDNNSGGWYGAHWRNRTSAFRSASANGLCPPLSKRWMRPATSWGRWRHCRHLIRRRLVEGRHRWITRPFRSLERLLPIDYETEVKLDLIAQLRSSFYLGCWLHIWLETLVGPRSHWSLQRRTCARRAAKRIFEDGLEKSNAGTVHEFWQASLGDLRSSL